MNRSAAFWRMAISVVLVAASSPTSAGGMRGDDGRAIRGITIGPIENAYHPSVGYGSDAFSRTLEESHAMGATWISLTPFGRVFDLNGTGVDPTFEAPFETNRANVLRAVHMAHAKGLRVMLVPHLWTESQEWRALIDPKTEAGWDRWIRSYSDYVLEWAKVAERASVDLLACGVELRTWVTGTHAVAFAELIRRVRRIYHGAVTYSANWDDAETTVILSELDVIGINAFYPLADKDGASFETLLAGGKRVAERVRVLSAMWNKPVLFTEIGYTARANTAITPWDWPEKSTNVVANAQAQAQAYRALISPLLEEPWFAGFFVWRTYSDPDDVSQEPEWGYSPRGRSAELVMRDAFSSRWQSDAIWQPGWVPRARVPGLYSGLSR